MVLAGVLAAPADVKVENARLAYGPLGQERKDEKFLPGDALWLRFDIEGLVPDATGKVTYAMGLEVTQKGKTKPKFKKDLEDYEARLTLGGTTLPAYARTNIGLDDDPGDYTLKITIKDGSSKGKGKEITIARSFEVAKSNLGFVMVGLISIAGEPVPAIGMQGQVMFLSCSLVGFEIGKDKAPHVSFEMQILDETGKPTVKELIKGDIKTEAKTPGAMIFQPMRVDLNRAGKFTIVLKATDVLAKKSTEQKLDLTVVKP
jgi:hypothetical protein